MYEEVDDCYDIPHNFIKFHGNPVYFRCLDRYVEKRYRNFKEGEKCF